MEDMERDGAENEGNSPCGDSPCEAACRYFYRNLIRLLRQQLTFRRSDFEY